MLLVVRACTAVVVSTAKRTPSHGCSVGTCISRHCGRGRVGSQRATLRAERGHGGEQGGASCLQLWRQGGSAAARGWRPETWPGPNMPQDLGAASLPDSRAQPSLAAKSLGAAELGEQPPGWTGACGQLLPVTFGHHCPDGRGPGARLGHHTRPIGPWPWACCPLPTRGRCFRRLGEEGCEGCYRTKDSRKATRRSASRFCASCFPQTGPTVSKTWKARA